VIVDDSEFWRQSVVKILEDAYIETVADVATAEELLEAVARHHPEVAIVDVRLSPSQGDEGARVATQLRREHPDMGVLLLSGVVEVAHARRLFSESPRGFGYLLKDRVMDVHDFVHSVRRVAAGGTAIDPDVVSQLLGGTRARDPHALDELSPRELEVLSLMAEGLSNQGICERLVLSLKTVETHVTSILSKLDLPIAAGDHRRVRAVLTYLELVADRPAQETDQGRP
jgi:DNA-binding NarL/FixJ family response regulator